MKKAFLVSLIVLAVIIDIENIHKVKTPGPKKMKVTHIALSFTNILNS